MIGLAILRSRALARIVTCGVAFVSSVSAGHAQALRGTVRDSASGRPVSGAVVTLLDSAGVTLGRNISNERGEFRVPRTSAHGQVRVVRIGFRPQTVRLAANAPDALDVAMVPTPVLLETVRVTAGNRCPARSDRLAAYALLEQARAGLLNTIVARDAHPAHMKRLQYSRELKDDGATIARQEVLIDNSADVRASYVSARTGEQFVQLGFRRDSVGLRAYFGPDAEALLDDQFRDGYCFHINPRDRERPNQVGLAFAPLTRRARRVDIEGTLWIDTVALSLHHIEFTYVGVERDEAAARAGGRISFREMRNGTVLIDQWWLRMLGAASDTVITASSSSVLTRYFTREMGGELARATWPDQTQWEASLGALNGRVVTRKAKPVGRSIVRLADTDYLANTNADGTFGMADLLPGPYTAVVLDTTLTPLGIALHTDFHFTAVRGRSTLGNIVAQTPDDYVEEFCAAVPRVGVDPVDPQSAWLIGRVVNADGNPVNGARVSLVFEQVTGSDGLFAYCRRLMAGERARIAVKAKSGKVVVMEVRLKTGINVVKVEMPDEK